MAGNIKGITIDIGGNTEPLNKALQGVNSTSRDLQNELKQVEKLLKLDPTNTDLLAQKQKLLADSVDNTKSKLETLKEAEKQVQQQMKEGKVSEEQYRALQREIITSEQKLKGLEGQGKQTNEVLSDEKPVNNLKNIGLAAGAAVAAAGVAFTGMANAVLENADELQRQADVTGLTAERLQELQYAGNNLGVDLETITGAQAKLTKSMAAATDESKGTGLAFATLGINVRDGNGHLRDAKDVMAEAFTALGNVKNETERNALAMQIFGKSAMDLNPLIKAGGDELTRLSQEAKSSGAVMSNEAVSGLDTFGDTLDNIKTSIIGSFGQALGDLMPQILELINKIDFTKVKEGISSFAEKVVGLLSFIIENGSTILSLVAGIGTAFIVWNVASTIMGVVEAINAFKLANEGATIAQWALNAAQSANPIGIIVVLIAGLIAAIVTLWNTNEDFRNALIGAWEAIKSAVSTAIDAVVKVFWTVINFVKDNWQGLLLFLVNPFAGAFKLLYDNCDGFKKFIDEFVGNVKTAFKTGLDKVVEFFTNLPSKIGTQLLSIATKFSEWKTSILKWITDNVDDVISKIVGFFSGLPAKAWTAIIGIKDKFGDLKTELVKWATTELPKFVSTFVGYIDDLPGKMINIGKNIVQGIWDGITGMATWLKDKVSGFVGGIVDGIKGVLGIHSPSKVFADEVGTFMAQGIGVGFQNEMPSVTTAMAKAIPVNKSNYINDTNSNANFTSSSTGRHNNQSEDIVINLTTTLDSKVISKTTSRQQRQNNLSRARGLGVVPV